MARSGAQNQPSTRKAVHDVANNFLAFPGWDTADRPADLDFASSPNAFHIRDRNGLSLSGQTTSLRTWWKVGIATNTFQFVRNSSAHASGSSGFPRFLGVFSRFTSAETFAHWGVYIGRADQDEANRKYHVFGMNFSDSSQESLSLEAAWGTPDGWQRDVSGEHLGKKGQEHDMYFAYEEFVVIAQYLLRKFYVTSLAPMFMSGTSIELIDFPWSSISLLGKSYRLLSGNCQHFAEFVLNNISADEYGQKNKDSVSYDDMAHHIWKKMLDISVKHRDLLIHRLTAREQELMFAGTTTTNADNIDLPLVAQEASEIGRLTTEDDRRQSLFWRYANPGISVSDPEVVQHSPPNTLCHLGWAYWSYDEMNVRFVQRDSNNRVRKVQKTGPSYEWIWFGNEGTFAMNHGYKWIYVDVWRCK